MNLRLAASLLFSTLLTGCMSSVRVYRADSLAARPRGIPFYARTAVCRRETVWLEPQYVLRFEGGGYGPVEKVLNRQQYQLDAVQRLAANPNLSGWKASILPLPGPDVVGEDGAEAAAQVENEEKSGNWVRVSNTALIQPVVDYGTVFYLNSARPFAGSTQVDAKLGTDGTLSEASAQLNDQTFATAVAPLASLTAAAATTVTELGLTAVAPNVETAGRLTVSTKMYRHTHGADSGAPARPGTCAPEAAGVFGGSYTVAEVSGDAKPAAAGDPAGAIHVSGTIQMPKASPPARP